jgi:two-component system, OmpR family, phosphate regulon sensor histidine kinase PhoR
MAEQLEARMRALEAEDELQGALVEALNDGVVAIDAQKRVVRINRSGRQLLAVQADTPFSLGLLPRDRALQEAIADALDGGTVDGVETRIGPRTVALSSRPLGVGGAVLTVFDLTGIRRLETVRRDFVANVSHELKTPLTAIRGFAETLQAELHGTESHAKFAETIRSNAERMQNLIDDLLDLSRIESGGWTPSPERLDVVAIAGDVAASYLDEAARRGCAIEIAVDRATALRADRVAIRQVLANLVENAVRYTPAGGVVTIFARADEAGVTLGVRDTGTGIAAEHLPRIFERFYRVDPARSRSAGGTGLGLAIVRHLVEAHGGVVRADSHVGRGTTVTAHFPA